MKLATLNNGKRDGELVVISRDLKKWVSAKHIASNLQDAIDDWKSVSPRLEELFNSLESGEAEVSFDTDFSRFMAPLPRAYGWSDCSVYLNHMELSRRLRGVSMPEGYREDPKYYDGVSHTFLNTGSSLPLVSEEDGLDFEGELGVILDDIPIGINPEIATDKILLFCLINDTTLRNVYAEQMRRGNNNFHGKPLCSMAPVVVTPNELKKYWDGKKLSLKMECNLNQKRIGLLDTGVDMDFDFSKIISSATKYRSFGAGTVLGTGTVSNRDESSGSACLAEVRMYEKIKFGEPKTPYLKDGDSFSIDIKDDDGKSVFGELTHKVSYI